MIDKTLSSANKNSNFVVENNITVLLLMKKNLKFKLISIPIFKCSSTSTQII